MNEDRNPITITRELLTGALADLAEAERVERENDYGDSADTADRCYLEGFVEALRAVLERAGETVER